jgi:hypothetical protein
MARPTQAITLTKLPRGWQPVQQLVAKFKAALARRGVRGRYAWHVEPNADPGTGAHCHLWWRGETLDAPLLREAALAAGAGPHVDVRAASAASVAHKVPTIDYGLKMILRDRPEHPEALWAAAVEYLDLNGGRLVHSTHGFYEDWHGRPVKGGLRAARRVAHTWPHPEPIRLPA